MYSGLFLGGHGITRNKKLKQKTANLQGQRVAGCLFLQKHKQPLSQTHTQTTEDERFSPFLLIELVNSEATRDIFIWVARDRRKPYCGRELRNESVQLLRGRR